MCSSCDGLASFQALRIFWREAQLQVRSEFDHDPPALPIVTRRDNPRNGGLDFFGSLVCCHEIRHSSP